MRYAQTATLERRTGNDSFGDATYAPPLAVRCRKEPAFGTVRNSLGVELNAETRYHFPPDVPITTSDKLDGTSVRYAETVVDTRGRLRGYEAAV